MNTEDSSSALLASQRAKLKAQAHRISAPGTLASNNFSSSSSGNGGLWGGLAPEAIAEQSIRSASPNSQRPKSTGSDYGITAGNSENNIMRSPNMGSTSFAELSPMVAGGSWASMVNTPVVPMFSQSENQGDAPLSPRFDTSAVNNALAGWNTVGASQSGTNNPNLVLDDAKKFRRPGRPNGNGTSPNNSYVGEAQRRAVSAGQAQQRNMLPASPNLSASTNSMLSPQQAAALSAQQNWRSVNGLLSSSTNNSNTATPITGNMSPADMANALLMQQQQMQQQMQAQLQLQQNLMVMNGMNPGMGLGNMNMLSPNFNAMGLGMPNSNSNTGGMSSPGGPNSAGISPGGRLGDKRSPRLGGHQSPGIRPPPPVIPGSGSNPDEVVDITLLNDVAAWLRSLRLHKYTPNFEGSKWQDMVKMDEAALEAKGVSAQGARRKLLKVFENVRVQLWNEERTGNNDGDTSADA